MNKQAAITYNKWYFWISGAVTVLGTIPLMLAPTAGTKLILGFDATLLPGVSGLFGHWGMMVVGIGILIFLCGKNKSLRATTIIYSLCEKSYLVIAGVYFCSISAELGQHYIAAIAADSLQIIGGLYYLFYTRRIEG